MKLILKIVPSIKLIIFVSLLICTNTFAQNTVDDIVHLTTIDQNIEVPIRLAVDNMNNIYTSDAKKNSIVKYDASGNYLESFVINGSPISIAINNNNNKIFVGNEDGTILKIETNGNISTFFTANIYPSDMAINPDGDLYIADSKNEQVIVLDLLANQIQSFGTGILISPTSIALDLRNERIFVGEHGALEGGSFGNAPCKVWVFDLLGNMIGSFGYGGVGDGRFYRIQGIDIGKCGNIYVNDSYQGNISVFDEDLNFVMKFGVFGDSLTQLNLPMDVLFDHEERILVTSTNNSKIEVFNVTDTLPNSNIQFSDATICAGETTDITINFTGTAPWDFSYTVDGLNPTNIITSDNPYILNVSTEGIYEIVSLSDAVYTGTCFSGSAIISTTPALPTSTITTINDSICEGEEINVNIDFTGFSPWTFTYTRNGLNPTSIITVNSYYVLPVTEVGLYEITNLKGKGCVGTSLTGSARIFVNSKPTSTFAEGNKHFEICQGESLDLHLNFTGTAPWNFSYFIDEGNPVTITGITSNNYKLTATQEGTYEVFEVSDLLCTNNSNRTYPEIIVKSLPTANMTNEDVLNCSNNHVDITTYFTGVAPWSLSYTVDGINLITVDDITKSPYTFQATYAGLYEISELSDINCSSTEFFGFANVGLLPVAIPNFSYNQNGLEFSFTNNSQNADSYLWDFGDTDTSTLENPVHLYSTIDYYDVYLTATNNLCGDSTYIASIDIVLNMDSVGNELVYEVYPNPSIGVFLLIIKNPTIANSKIEISNLNGQTLYNKKFHTNNIIESIDISNQSAGIYIVKYITEKQILTKKLIINKRY